MTNSIIAIKGNYLDKTNEIFNSFNYIDLELDKQFDDFDKFNEYLFENYFEFTNKDISLRGIWTDNNWTVINDPEMVDSIDEEVLLSLSKKLNTDILTFIIQTNSGSFGFTKYNKGIERHFYVVEGEITDNLYLPLEQEKGLNINEEIFTDDIVKLAKNFDIDIEGNNCKVFITKQFGYNDEKKKELEQYNTTQKSNEKKPWWKFW